MVWWTLLKGIKIIDIVSVGRGSLLLEGFQELYRLEILD